MGCCANPEQTGTGKTMLSRFTWLKLILLRYYRDMGLRVGLYALLSVVAALIGPFAASLIDEGFRSRISLASVEPVLTILATSMLAVSTFSLNIMVSAHRAASSATTPRVHRILLENTTTQSVLAVFIGAFVYSLGSIVLYRTGFYSEDSAIIVMGVTILVVVWVVISLLRWIQHLTTLGSVEDSLRSARDRARDALMITARYPAFGASAISEQTRVPVDTTELRAGRSGYLQLIDVDRLQSCLPPAAFLYLDIRPGMHVLEDQIIARVSGQVDAQTCAELLQAFTFDDHRTHDQDAEFGVIVLSEIASKALSPGINDPGTAIEALLMLKTLLWDYAHEAAVTDTPSAPSVFVRSADPADLVRAAFAPIARDGAGNVEVALHLRRALLALSDAPDPKLAEASRIQADIALSQAEQAGLLKHEMDQLRAVTASSRP
jgi:uncharacterized membrane protein